MTEPSIDDILEALDHLQEFGRTIEEKMDAVIVIMTDLAKRIRRLTE